jgi:hypothetical protein
MFNFNALAVTKFIVSGIVGIGTAKIVGGVIKEHVKPETLIDKVTITAAAWVLSGVTTTATKKYTNEIIDGVAEAVTAGVDKFKHDAKLGRIDREESTFEEEGLNPDDYRKSPETNKWVKIEKYPEGDLLTDEAADDEHVQKVNDITDKVKKNAS